MATPLLSLASRPMRDQSSCWSRPYGSLFPARGPAGLPTVRAGGPVTRAVPESGRVVADTRPPPTPPHPGARARASTLAGQGGTRSREGSARLRLSRGQQGRISAPSKSRLCGPELQPGTRGTLRALSSGPSFHCGETEARHGDRASRPALGVLILEAYKTPESL